MRIKTRQQIVDEARSWLGTPFVHQGRVKGIGCDCAAIIVEVANLMEMDARDIKGYSRSPNAGQLQRCLCSQLEKIAVEDARAGDVFLMRFNASGPQHIAIKTDKGIIHSYSRVSKAGSERGSVVEHRLNDMWQKRICAAFRFPDVKD